MNRINTMSSGMYREFDGKRYELEKSFTNRRDAKTFASKKRKETWNGYTILARVSPNMVGYGVYTTTGRNVRYDIKSKKI